MYDITHIWGSLTTPLISRHLGEPCSVIQNIDWSLVTLNLSRNRVMISSCNGLAPVWPQIIAWNNDDLLSIGPYVIDKFTYIYREGEGGGGGGGVQRERESGRERETDRQTDRQKKHFKSLQGRKKAYRHSTATNQWYILWSYIMSVKVSLLTTITPPPPPPPPPTPHIASNASNFYNTALPCFTL